MRGFLWVTSILARAHQPRAHVLHSVCPNVRAFAEIPHATPTVSPCQNCSCVFFINPIPAPTTAPNRHSPTARFIANITSHTSRPRHHIGCVSSANCVRACQPSAAGLGCSSPPDVAEAAACCPYSSAHCRSRQRLCRPNAQADQHTAPCLGVQYRSQRFGKDQPCRRNADRRRGGSGTATVQSVEPHIGGFSFFRYTCQAPETRTSHECHCNNGHGSFVRDTH